MSKKEIRNICILAHVDAGKTTITENFLFESGATNKIGNVDKATAVTDFLDVEKQRGISVKAANTSFVWQQSMINLIDTPGHVDFSAEVERVLQVLDGAILVVSASEGVQAHTYTLWEALKALHIPTLIFINKIDRPDSDISLIIKELNSELNCNAVPLQAVINEGEANADVVALWQEENEKTAGELKSDAIETLANLDDEILEFFLDEKPVSGKFILQKIEKLYEEERIVPVLTGCAKNNVGTKALLDAALQFIPPAQTPVDETPSGIVYKIEHDKNLGKLAHIRLFSGVLKNRDTIVNITQKKEEKISQIKKVSTNKAEDVKELKAGDIGIVSGMPDVQTGDVLGSLRYVKQSKILNVPLLTVQVLPVEQAQYAALAEALTELSAEDSRLGFEWLRNEKEMHINVMGEIQMEILEMMLKNRYGIAVKFNQPTVIYKETPSKSAEGFVRYWMPKPCWAIMKFRVEPGERGSGVKYRSEVSVNDIQRKYQNEVERTIPKALAQGIKGWETTDLKITLLEGEDHEIHSRPGDFIIATHIGVMRALENAGTTLLEPVLQFEIRAPEDFLGQITGNLVNMRATFGSPQFNENRFKLSGTVPVATSTNYAIRLNSLTGGKGKIRFSFGGYNTCPDESGKTRQYRGVNPLNESQWILHARGAFKNNERDL